jgi:ABC-type transport system involved in multi-copper enzyme maturation permease subunit
MSAPGPPAKPAAANALVGPLFFWDVVRLARRGRGTALRFLYGSSLLAALAFVYHYHFPRHDLLRLSGDDDWVSLKDQASFAHSFANTLLLAQNVAVLVLVPAYLAGAVAEEKEKKTLDLLFTTALTDREIVLGKLLGRLMHVGGVLLVGLPVLSLAQLWGGVDVTVLLANFAVTALTLLSVAGLSLFFSVTMNSAMGALVGSYAASAVLAIGCLCPLGEFALSPLAFPIVLDHRISEVPTSLPGVPSPAPGDHMRVAAELLTYYTILHGVIGLIAVAMAVSLLRPTAPSRAAEPPPLAEKQRRPAPEPILLPELVGSTRESPPIGDDPLLWKEVLKGTGPAPPQLRYELAMPGLFVVVVAGLVWILVAIYWLSDQGGQQVGEVIAGFAAGFNIMLRAGVTILLTVVCIGVGFGAAGSVVGERARRTLDGLLTLPLSRMTILRAKWLGSLLHMRYFLSLVAAGWLLGICTGALHPLALPFLVLIVAAQLTFVASLGTWVSVTARSIPQAHVIFAVLLLLFFGGGWLIWLSSDPPRSGRIDFEPADLVLIGLTPWRAWWALTFPLVVPERVEHVTGQEAALLPVAAAVYLLAAAALWKRAVFRFKEESGPGPRRP